MKPRLRLRDQPARLAIPWSAFRLGYLTALDDIDRTGLQPWREREKERCAKRAYEHLLSPDEEGAA